MSGILEGLWSSWSGNRSSAEAMVEVLLMASLADGELTPEGYDRIARALRDHPQLHTADWDWVVHRAGELAEEAPLFFDARVAIAERLTDRNDQRLALTMAARLVGAGRPLDEAPRAVLGALAGAFGIPEVEQSGLFGPSGVVDSTDLGFARCDFNEPTRRESPSLFEALRGAESDIERRLLLFKLVGVRRLLWSLGSTPAAHVVKLGERLRFEQLHFRVDAVVEHEGRRSLVRFLAANEALHRAEHGLMRALAERLPETASVLVVHDGPLSPEDDSFIRGVDPERLGTRALLETS